MLEEITTHYKAVHPEQPSPSKFPGRFVSHTATPLYIARCRACGTERESRSPLPNLCDTCSA